MRVSPSWIRHVTRQVMPPSAAGLVERRVPGCHSRSCSTKTLMRAVMGINSPVGGLPARCWAVEGPSPGGVHGEPNSDRTSGSKRGYRAKGPDPVGRPKSSRRPGEGAAGAEVGVRAKKLAGGRSDLCPPTMTRSPPRVGGSPDGDLP